MLEVPNHLIGLSEDMQPSTFQHYQTFNFKHYENNYHATAIKAKQKVVLEVVHCMISVPFGFIKPNVSNSISPNNFISHIRMIVSILDPNFMFAPCSACQVPSAFPGVIRDMRSCYFPNYSVGISYQIWHETHEALKLFHHKKTYR